MATNLEFSFCVVTFRKAFGLTIQWLHSYLFSIGFGADKQSKWMPTMPIFKLALHEDRMNNKA
jgi:hypothetical protein